MKLRNPVFVLFSEMGRGIPNDSYDRTMIPEKSEPLTPCDRSVAPTDPAQVDEPVVGDVLDHETNFVAMRGEQNLRFGGAPLQCRPRIPVSVVRDSVCPRFDGLCPSRLPLGFKTARTRNGEEVQERR